MKKNNQSSIEEACPETIRNYIINQGLRLIAFSQTAKDDWDFSYLGIKLSPTPPLLIDFYAPV